MSRIDDQSELPEARNELGKVERESLNLRVAPEDQMRLTLSAQVEQDRQLRTDELAVQSRLHLAAIERAHKHTTEEALLAEELAAQLAEDSKSEVLVRERIRAEEEECAALAARVDMERQLTVQLELLVEQKKIERTQSEQRSVNEEKLRLAIAERIEQERLLQAAEMEAQMRLHETAIGEARKRTAEELLLAECHAAKIKEEARLEDLAGERAKAEQAAQEAFAARIDMERRLAAQIDVRIEQERVGRAQASRKAAHAELLRVAVAGREAQERQLRIEELATQAQLHESAIAEAHKCALDESRKIEELTSHLAEEARLEVLARKRAEIEQAAQTALAARIEAERTLVDQIEARIEQEEYERELSVLRKSQEEKLMLVTAKREAHQRLLRTEEMATQTQSHQTAIIAPARPIRGRETRRATFISSLFHLRYLGYCSIALLVIFFGYIVVGKAHFHNNKLEGEFSQPGSDQKMLSTATNSQTTTVRATIEQAAVEAKPEQREEAEIGQLVQQWAEAWSRRDVAAYLSFYAADFNLPEGMQRSEWEAQRQSRLRKYHSIEVILKNIKISYSGGDVASVSFAQNFQADNFREIETQKELFLKNVQGRWLIVGEKNL